MRAAWDHPALHVGSMEQATDTQTTERETRNPVARAFAILQWMVDAAGTAWGLREIARGVGMHPSTLYRVLAHLEAEGIVRQDTETDRYSLGLGFLRLAWKAADRNSVREVALPAMKALV